MTKSPANDKRIRDCPCCGDLLQFYDDCGWIHMVDGDADCYGALSYGKGPPLSDRQE
jgi:hypothetical protein